MTDSQFLLQVRTPLKTYLDAYLSCSEPNRTLGLIVLEAPKDVQTETFSLSLRVLQSGKEIEKINAILQVSFNSPTLRIELKTSIATMIQPDIFVDVHTSPAKNQNVAAGSVFQQPIQSTLDPLPSNSIPSQSKYFFQPIDQGSASSSKSSTRQVSRKTQPNTSTDFFCILLW